MAFSAHLVQSIFIFNSLSWTTTTNSNKNEKKKSKSNIRLKDRSVTARATNKSNDCRTRKLRAKTHIHTHPYTHTQRYTYVMSQYGMCMAYIYLFIFSLHRNVGTEVFKWSLTRLTVWCVFMHLYMSFISLASVRGLPVWCMHTFTYTHRHTLKTYWNNIKFTIIVIQYSHIRNYSSIFL